MGDKRKNQTCAVCVLDGNYPGISFDEQGICNYCRRSKKTEEQASLRKKYENKFLEVVGQCKNRSTYDCLLAYSGGKDSTYTLYQLKNKYQLKVLAVTYDNWFQSEASKQNIRNVMMNLNVDHICLTPRFDTLKKIIRAAVENSIVSMKALERATSICTVCLSIIRFSCIRMAVEMEIPMVVTGLSPGQAPVVTAVFKTNAKMMKSMQEAVTGPLHKLLGDEINPFFLEEKHFCREDKFPYSLNPLSFLSYCEKDIYDVIRGLGWRSPEDTDSNSTNCLLNAFAGKVHQEQLGFHPYAFELAGLVRDGHMTREDGLKKLATPFDERVINEVKNKLGIA
jgi:tRNA(Ile)-lysidine synthase TilS/MesJ